MAKYIKTEEGYKGLEESISVVTDNKMDKINPTGTGSFSMNRKAGTVIGDNSHAEGFNTTASGNYSHAEGGKTTASGEYSHAEGSNTTAISGNSHAEGQDTTADGFSSHAEGYGTVASGSHSHAEGLSTKAIGYISHAEGNSTQASGGYSHAEGNQTTASSQYSHAEGNQTTANGGSSHAEGSYTKAHGVDSHAEGYMTTASGQGSHAEGYMTTASGQGSHAEGSSMSKFSSVVTTTNPTTGDIITAWKTKKFSIAKGDYSHVEGKDNLALDKYSHAEGGGTTANNYYSHAEGSTTTASGFGSHAEGGSTTASKNYSHAEGMNTIASNHQSHAEGTSTTASGYSSHAEGSSTKASGAYSHAEGDSTTASGYSSHAEGISTEASGDKSHAEGGYTTASGNYSHAEGRRTKASGKYSHAQGIFNIEDTSNIYADIIGNGTSDTARSNATTVDWNGNAWFAGDIYTGSTSGTNKDDGSKKLATEEYVNNSIAATSVLYTAQSLTEEQKAQARQNIGSFDIFDLPNLIKFNVKSKILFGDKIMDGVVFALNDFQPIDINTADTETVEAWRTLFHTFSFNDMQTLLGNTDMYIALAFLIDKNMFGENFYSTHTYSNCAWFGRNHKFMKFYSWATSDPAQKIISGYVYDLEKSVGEFKYKALTNELEWFSYSYPLTALASTSTNGKEIISQINMRADPTNDMEIATKHYVDNSIASTSVLHTAQSLTDEEQAQARANIGAQDLYNGLTPVNYSCTDGTYSVSDTVYLESGNIISPVDTVSNDVRIAFRFINFWGIPAPLDSWKNDIKKYKLLIDNGYLENNTIWYSKPDKKLKKQIRFGTHNTLGNYIIFNFNYDYEVIGQLVYYVDTDTISTGTDTYLNYTLKRDKNNVLSYSAIKLSSDPTEPMQIATKQYVDNAIANIPAIDLSNYVQTNKENILGDNGSIISNSSRGNSLTISNGVIEQKNSNQDSVSLGNAKVVFSHDIDGSSSTRGNGTFTMYGRKGEEYFKFKATNGDVKVSGIATPTLSNDAVNKSYVDLQIANIEIPTVPTNVSAFTNDAGYLTEHQSLADYALKSEIPSPYSLPTASATELGGVKADSAEASDTQPVRIGGDGKLYTAAGGTDISLGLTSAAVGQTIKVKAVDESGKPTEWEAAEEKKWIEICDVPLTEDFTPVAGFSVTALPDGTPLEGMGLKEICFAGAMQIAAASSYSYGTFFVNDKSLLIGQNFTVKTADLSWFRGKFELLGDGYASSEWGNNPSASSNMLGGGININPHFYGANNPNIANVYTDTEIKSIKITAPKATDGTVDNMSKLRLVVFGR